MNQPTPTPAPSRTYTNVVLTVIAGLMVVNWLGQDRPASLATSALAQPADPEGFSPDDPSGRISAAEQRKQIIMELRQLGGRLERIESTLNKGISVKVTDMPAMRQAEPAKSPERPAKAEKTTRAEPAAPASK